MEDLQNGSFREPEYMISMAKPEERVRSPLSSVKNLPLGYNSSKEGTPVEPGKKMKRSFSLSGTLRIANRPNLGDDNEVLSRLLYDHQAEQKEKPPSFARETQSSPIKAPTNPTGKWMYSPAAKTKENVAYSAVESLDDPVIKNLTDSFQDTEEENGVEEEPKTKKKRGSFFKLRRLSLPKRRRSSTPAEGTNDENSQDQRKSSSRRRRKLPTKPDTEDNQKKKAKEKKKTVKNVLPPSLSGKPPRDVENEDQKRGVFSRIKMRRNTDTSLTHKTKTTKSKNDESSTKKKKKSRRHTLGDRKSVV